MQHLNVLVSGKVQGVWYRKSAQLKADELSLRGFIRNESDGSVYLEIEGDEDDLDTFIEWCWEGPPLASVSNVEYSERDWIGFTAFEVQR